MPTSDLARIERSTFIRAPRSRVWRAIANVAEFAKWFEVEAEGEFASGARVRMVTTNPAYPGIAFTVTIDQVTPEQFFSWHWHPGVEQIESEPPTRVEFHLADAEGGTTVTVIESGFDRLSLARRAKAFEENDKGWIEMLAALGAYVGHAA